MGDHNINQTTREVHLGNWTQSPYPRATFAQLRQSPKIQITNSDCGIKSARASGHWEIQRQCIGKFLTLIGVSRSFSALVGGSWQTRVPGTKSQPGFWYQLTFYRKIKSFRKLLCSWTRARVRKTIRKTVCEYFHKTKLRNQV